jgi:hypothetical protein
MGLSVGIPDIAAESRVAPSILSAVDVQRGQLLYETYCIACHTTQAHWRDKHIVTTWADLLYQVTRMQKNAGQDWTLGEITDVAAYLNDMFYKLPCPAEDCGGPEAGVGAEMRFACSNHSLENRKKPSELLSINLDNARLAAKRYSYTPDPVWQLYRWWKCHG